MSKRDVSAFIGHVVMAMRFVEDFISGMTLDDFLADPAVGRSDPARRVVSVPPRW